MAKILVAFGDSWPWGAELDKLSGGVSDLNIDDESLADLNAAVSNYPTPKSYSEHVKRAEFIRDKFRYPTLVAEKLKCDKVIDFTGYGTSLNHLFLYLADFVKIYQENPADQYIFLVSLTADDRDLYFDPLTGDPKEIMPWDGGFGAYYKYFYHQKTGETHWAKNVMMLQMFCKLHDIPDFYFQAFRPQANHLRYQHMIDYSRIYCHAKKSFMEMFADRESVDFYTSDKSFYQPEVAKYFYPCENHPNILGHKTIAEEIISFIKGTNPELIPQ